MMKQDPLVNTTSAWKQQEVYEPAYQDTVTIFPEYVADLPGPVPLITQFEVKMPRPDSGTKRLSADYDWITIVLVIGFLLFAFVKYNFSRRLAQLVKACFVQRAVAYLYREGNPFNEQVALALGIIFLLTSSLFIYAILGSFGQLPDDLLDPGWIYFSILIINGSYWLLKVTASKVLAYIFKTQEATGNYLLNNFLFNVTLGLFFLLSLPFVIYSGSDIILEAAFMITAIMLAYKVLRGILVGLSISRFPLFYLFLYICTLEVAPLLIAAKLFMTYSGI